MAISSLTKLTVPLATNDSASSQGLLMPKLQYRFRVTLENFGISTPTTESSKEVIVVKSILRREQTLQSLRDAVGRSKFNLKLVSALMERYREATVSTIEAVSQ